MTVQTNLTTVNESIKQSCARAGRSLQDIKLVAVTKTVGIEKTNEVIEAGIIDLGENRNEGFLQKYEHFGSKSELAFYWIITNEKSKRNH